MPDKLIAKLKLEREKQLFKQVLESVLKKHVFTFQQLIIILIFSLN